MRSIYWPAAGSVPRQPDTAPVSKGTLPAYEMYGGLIAKSNAEFLYESTLFWHWPPGECYGDPGWEAEWLLTTQGVPAAVYEEMLADAGFFDFAELVAYVESLQACKGQKRKKDGCHWTQHGKRNSQDGYYTLAAAVCAGGAIANCYVITASAAGKQANDTGCAAITYDSTGVKAPVACW